jgi:hypothetical protein
MIKACEDVAHSAGGITGLLQLEGISYDESDVIAAIRRHLAK